MFKKYKNEIIVGVITFVIGSIIWYAISSISYINVISSIFNFFVDILLFKFNVYIFEIIFVVFIFWGISYLTKRVKNELKDNFPPPYINYRKDKFKEWIWVWNFDKTSYDSNYHITQLIPLCPRCRCQLRHDFDCPNCEYRSYGHYESPNDIEKIIQQKIYTNEYKNRNFI